MSLKMHAAERIIGRTKMSIAEVLSVISRGATVELGRSKNVIFLLFYSLLDNESKVALVDADDGSLISIWERNFRFPTGVRRPTRKQEELVKTFEQTTTTNKTT